MATISSKPVLKAPNGAPLLWSLFIDNWVKGTYDAAPVYTLKDDDYKGYPSLYRLYMDMEDPTEWVFATTYLASWEHWERLCECEWFKPIVARWRKEMALKVKARALNRIRQESENPDSRNYYNANRFLVDKGWLDKEVPGPKGRPKKQEIRDAFHKEVEEDRKRLGLN